MKFRSDFVTNSSSSCYVISYRVQGIPFQPLPDDYMGEVSVSYADVSIKDVIEKIKSGASVDEIATMFAESTRNYDCLGHMFSEGLDSEIMNSELSYEETLKKISEGEFEGADEDDVYRASDYLERIQSFRERMNRLSSASDIKEIVETLTYTGWGEFLSDSIESFVGSLDTETLSLADRLLGDEWWSNMSEATEETHYSVPEGTIVTTKQGYADTRDYILDRYWDRFEDCDAEDVEYELPALEFIAAEVEGESCIPQIVEVLLSKNAVDCAEQFLDKMTALGGKHAEVAESLRVRVEEAKRENK